MSFLSFFGRGRSAPVARDRLQLLLAHERALSGRTDLAAVLQKEILAVISRHIAIDHDKVVVKLDRGERVSTLEIDIEMPDPRTGCRELPVNPRSEAGRAPEPGRQ